MLRGDFSRWVDGVFGDRALADELRRLEAKHRARSSPETISEVASAIRGRYDLTEENRAVAGVH
jgi:hypothetical protein